MFFIFNLQFEHSSLENFFPYRKGLATHSVFFDMLLPFL